jgi:hypothetical protein
VDAGNALLFLYTADWKQQRNDANSGGLNIYIYLWGIVRRNQREEMRTKTANSERN